MSALYLLSRFWNGLARGLLLSLAVLSLGACGGGGNSDGGGGSSGADGQVVIGLTDAPGDFLSYTVDVVSLSLTRANGTVVNALPTTSRVDFAQYTDLTEFLTVATIPSGVYVSAQMTLDYRNADIQVEDASGAAVKASVQDSNGQAITTLDLTVKFDANRRLLIAPGIPAHLTLDFNLEASNSVDLSGATPMVTVEPFLIADVNPQAPKIHRVRGPLKTVDTAASQFQIAIRPFHLASGSFGELSVVTDADTAFEIDGAVYVGADGLAQLAAKPVGTATVALGDLHVGQRRFVAREVYAGSSVAFGTLDAVTGNVIARSGDVLTVRGATLVRADGSFSFRDTVTVTLTDTTRFTRQAANSMGLDKNSVSVGQRITALGRLTAGNPSQLDTAEGLVRLLITTVTGTVNSLAADSFDMNVQTFNGRPISLFDFSGTGSTPSDPANYRVMTGNIVLGSLGIGQPVRVRGFVAPFGQAGNSGDFTAISLIQVASAPAQLAVNWDPATAQPFTSSSASGVLVNLNGAGQVHHVLRSGVLTELVNAPMITPRAEGLNLFAIGDRGTVQVYTQFDLYQQAINASLTQGRQARRVGAHGRYEDVSATLTADRMFLSLE